MDQGTVKGGPAGVDTKSTSETKEADLLLHAFYAIPSIDKAWTSPSRKGDGGIDVMVQTSQINLPANAKRSFITSVYIPNAETAIISEYRWSPFPFELTGAPLVVPSPSGEKLLIIRKSDATANDERFATKIEIWGPGQLLNEIYVAETLHGSIFSDEWFEGISWSQDEKSFAYVAEEPVLFRPLFGQRPSPSGHTRSDTFGAGTWKGQGDWVEDWGESYSGTRRPVLFVANIDSGAVQAVEGIPKDVSAGQVVWAPRVTAQSSDSTIDGFPQSLVFVGWSSYADNFSTPRKLGMKYCQNRPCHLYAVRAPVPGSSEPSKPVVPAVKLTEDLCSATFPRFSPDGKLLVFLSSQAAVISGAHTATNSLHFINWPGDGVVRAHMQITDVVKVVQRAEEDCFPGLYCSHLISYPWFRDNSTLVLSSAWRSQEVILAVNIESGNVTRISPADSPSSWNLLGLQNSCFLAVVSSPTQPHSLKIGHLSDSTSSANEWSWLNISVPFLKLPKQVQSSMQAMRYEILQIPVPLTDSQKSLTEGAKQPFEAILVSPKTSNMKPFIGGTKIPESIPPLVLVLHGGPHSVAQTSFWRPGAFLSALGFSLLHVNYRGSLGFGEEALQSLPGNVGRQDVGDVLAALDKVIEDGLADPAKVAVLGGSHGGFLAAHLIGQAPSRFTTGVLRSPVCNLSHMVGVTDIPDWCYFEVFGKQARTKYSEMPSASDLNMLYQCSPIAHLFKVKVPTFFLMGAYDRRVPISNGFQYIQGLRARGLEVKVIQFPDCHPIDRPQSEFEGYLSIGIWLKRFM